MSWFDAAGLANIAKSALKEAQRTIDKALDIKEDPNIVTNTPVDTNPEDFFGTWGISQSGQIECEKPEIPEETVKESKMSSSIWGSFTGSFFDAAKGNVKTPSIDSLEDIVDSGTEHFNQSKLVVQHSDDTDNLSFLSVTETKKAGQKEKGDSSIKHDKKELVEINLDAADDTLLENIANITTVRRCDKPSNIYTNRLSVVSSESGKNSSESVDIVTCSTECTTSPESDVLSLGLSVSASSSIPGLKPTSDSVEILGESLTSPSSVEVIGTDSTNSRRQSQHTDEFVSPLDSPWSDEKSSSIEKISPESVEVIQEDQDENSMAEDTISYTSISESTSATVLDSAFNLHLKSQKMLKDTFNRPEIMNESNVSDLSLSPEKNYNFTDAITRAPSRINMHLPLTQINQLIDTQPQSNKQELANILQKTNIIDIPHDTNIASCGSETQFDLSIDDGSQSDKTVIGSNDNIMESSSDTSTTTEMSSNSTYLKNMLADAMTEKCSEQQNIQFMYLTSDTNIPSNKSCMLESISISHLDIPLRENSPNSSESRSDLVKMGSDHTSGHTSGDELETTTSSDIEIISSPNGDSSSTQSRQSPAKQTYTQTKSEESAINILLSKMSVKKDKGHTRELSEASSISDDSHSSEKDRLLKKISEMNDILESRESKLIDVNRRNAELQDLNNNLKFQLDLVITNQLESADLSQVTEEYTQRLSALEKKFQQAIREKDNLRKQLEQTKQEAAARMSKGELEAFIFEKDDIIKELREEGEKLSRQQLQHCNIIKKLRAKEKENESTIKNLRERIEGLSTESDRLKKLLIAKEEVERCQIEAVHQLTTNNKKLDSDVTKLKGQLDDLTQKYDTTKKSLDAAKKELIDRNKTSNEVWVREQMLESLENQKRATESQNEEISNQLEDLRYKLQQSEYECIKKEQQLRQENMELLDRLEEAETRNEELSQSILEVSRPLVRQLESLQAAHNLKVSALENIEEEFATKIRELQTKLQTSSNVERIAREDCVNIKSKLAELEGQLSTANHKIQLMQMQLEQKKTERHLREKDLLGKINNLNHIIKKDKEIIVEQEKNISILQQELIVEKSTNELERKRIKALQDHTDEKSENREGNVDRTSPRIDSNSPTLSLGKVSISESVGSSFWSQEEPFDIGQTPRYTNMFEMQMLQSNLKQREGEVQQFQWELNRREQERSLLNSEISILLTRVEDLESKTNNYDILKTQFNELQQQYDTLCQLYGEKVEENEELKLDLQDVKEMYKSQIDELLKQKKQNMK